MSAVGWLLGRRRATTGVSKARVVIEFPAHLAERNSGRRRYERIETNWAPGPDERDAYRPEVISPHLAGGEP